MTKRVCKYCNDYLGARVDKPLIGNVLIAMQRQVNGLAGNSGSVPDALREVMGRDATLVGTGQKVRLERPGGGPYTPRLLYHAEDVLTDDGKVQEVRVRIDSKDRHELPKIIARLRKRNSLRALSDTEMEAVINGPAIKVETIETPTVHSKVSVDLIAFRPGILKIAYELAFLWFGDNFLDQPEAEELRQVIRYEKDLQSSDLKCSFAFGNHPPFDLWRHDTAHLAFSSEVQGRTVIAIRLFNDVVAVVDVGTADDKQPGQFHRYEFKTRTYTSSSLRFELYQIVKRHNRIALHLSTALKPFHSNSPALAGRPVINLPRGSA